MLGDRIWIQMQMAMYPVLEVLRDKRVATPLLEIDGICGRRHRKAMVIVTLCRGVPGLFASVATRKDVPAPVTTSVTPFWRIRSPALQDSYPRLEPRNTLRRSTRVQCLAQRCRRHIPADVFASSCGCAMRIRVYVACSDLGNKSDSARLCFNY